MTLQAVPCCSGQRSSCHCLRLRLSPLRALGDQADRSSPRAQHSAWDMAAAQRTLAKQHWVGGRQHVYRRALLTLQTCPFTFSFTRDPEQEPSSPSASLGWGLAVAHALGDLVTCSRKGKRCDPRQGLCPLWTVGLGTRTLIPGDLPASMRSCPGKCFVNTKRVTYLFIMSAFRITHTGSPEQLRYRPPVGRLGW